MKYDLTLRVFFILYYKQNKNDIS